MLVTVDTETTGLNTEKFECGCIYLQDKKEFTFFKKEEMFNKLIKLIEKEGNRGHSTYIYAHNHSYDWHTYARGNWDYPGLEYRSLNPFFIGYKKGLFLDSYLIFKMALKDIGNIIGTLKIDIDKELLIKENLTSEELILKAAYCMQDCKVLMNALLMLKTEMNKLGYKPKRMISSGQIAMSTFMTHIRRNKDWYAMSDSSLKKLHQTNYDKEIRVAFRGARCQTFKIGKYENVTYLDVNSLYPYIMSTMRFPDLKSEKPVKGFPEKYHNNIGIVKCTLRTNNRELGILPIRYKTGLYFPNKEITLKSIWTIDEVMQAIRNGYELIEANWCLVYNETSNPMTDYIKNLYNAKKNANPEMKMAIKLILNSLFGKFAQKNTRKEIRFIERKDISNNQGWHISGVLGNKYMITRTREGPNRYFVNPIISTLITAGARSYLYKHLEMVDKEDLLYCDTDSIILKNFDKYRERFKIDNEIGNWKIVHDNENINIKGRKQYIIGNEVKIAGVHRKEATKEAFENNEVTFTRMNTMLSTGNLQNAGRIDNITMKLGQGNIELPNLEEIIDL